MVIQLLFISAVSTVVGLAAWRLAKERERLRHEAAVLAIESVLSSAQIGKQFFPEDPKGAKMLEAAALEARMLKSAEDWSAIAERLGCSIHVVREDAVAWSLASQELDQPKISRECREAVRIALVVFASLSVACWLWSHIQRWLESTFL